MKFVQIFFHIAEYGENDSLPTSTWHTIILEQIKNILRDSK